MVNHLSKPLASKTLHGHHVSRDLTALYAHTLLMVAPFLGLVPAPVNNSLRAALDHPGSQANAVFTAFLPRARSHQIGRK